VSSPILPRPDDPPPGRRLSRRQALLAGIAPLLAAAAGGCDRHQAGSGPAASPTAAPTTAAPTTATTAASAARSGSARSGLVAFGDFGGGPAQPAVARAMERWAADHRVDALVTTGDNVYRWGEPRLFAAQLDRPYATLRRARPMWVTLGNHDEAAGHGGEQLAHLGLPALPYARDLPGLQLLFLDANRVDAAQAAWLEARLRESGPALRAVVFHQPAWSCSRHDSSREVDRLWVPVIERHRVPLVLNGHDHNYQRFVSGGGVTYVVTGGGGRELYPVDGCAAGAPPRTVAQVRHHFTAVEVNGATLTVTAVADDGAVIDRTVIRR
jgi:3',5'-cyclic AMP phosphodiesterase CpdA